MDKITYLAELAEGLARWVPERERQDILCFYAEYFDEAGPDREAEVVAELGDPWALSCRLAVEGGYVTHEKAASWRPRKTWRRALIGAAVGLSVFWLVFGIGLLATNLVRSSSSVANIPMFQVDDPMTVVDWGVSSIEGDDFQVGYAYMDSYPGYYFMDGESIAPFSSIDADINLGNIEIVAGDDYTLTIRRSEALIGYEPTWEVIGGVLKIRDGRGAQFQTEEWNELLGALGVGQGGMEVTITVPQYVIMDKISVRTGLGDVLLWGLAANTMTAGTGLGDVECYEARGIRRLELSTGLGDVNLVMDEAQGGLYIGLKTGLGNVDATLCGSETDYSYTLDCDMGYVAVSGVSRGNMAEYNGNTLYRLDASSGMGDVKVYFVTPTMLVDSGVFFFSQTD